MKCQRLLKAAVLHKQQSSIKSTPVRVFIKPQVQKHVNVHLEIVPDRNHPTVQNINAMISVYVCVSEQEA